MSINNVLADRYASREMVALFEPTNRIIAERKLWIAVLKAQKELGLDVPEAAIADYEAQVENIDLESIRDREKQIKHDIPAKIAEFNSLAGHQHIHKAMTSRDLTENVEQYVTFQALQLISERAESILAILSDLAEKNKAISIVGRSHNVPAQITTVGKRIASIAEEFHNNYKSLQNVLTNFKIRGIKGPVGTQADQINLLGSYENAQQLDDKVTEFLFAGTKLNSVGQIYPRSYDFEVVSALVQQGAALSNFALLVRLMASHDLASEGFLDGQIGSSAMPHKMNARSCERMNGLYEILKGHLTMAANLSGSQWNEGDVSCSVVRRVVIPDSFFAIDGLFETAFSVFKGFSIYPAVIDAELEKYLPFLATTALLVHAINNGLGREEAHEIIKSYALETIQLVRADQGSSDLLFQKLAADANFPGDYDTLHKLIEDIDAFCGAAVSQTEKVIADIDLTLVDKDTTYRGSEIL